MPEQRNERERHSERQRTLSREVLSLAESAAERGVRAVPGNEWGFHYPLPPSERARILREVYDGTCAPHDAAMQIAPDTVVYNTADIETHGLDKVRARLNDVAAYVAYYDYQRFAEFVARMRSEDAAIEDVERLYSEMVRARIQKTMYDAYGSTGRRQVHSALEQEVRGYSHMHDGTSVERVARALKARWCAHEQRVISETDADALLAKLSGNERDGFTSALPSYVEFVNTGSKDAYEQLVHSLQNVLEKNAHIQHETLSDSMKALAEELKEYESAPSAPGAPGDTAVVPEDSDEYHTPPPSAESGAEGAPSRLFTVTPSLPGYYISGRKSYYDVTTKTWSKKKQLVPYAGSAVKGARHTLSGYATGGIISLPLPETYAIDTHSVQCDASVQMEMFRDQNGCFYARVAGAGAFSFSFGVEQMPFSPSPIAEDVKMMHTGRMSDTTEDMLRTLAGDAMQKASRVQGYIHAHHFYPGGGDPRMAQALQYKLRAEVPSEQYIHALDVSEYLECYSANTLFVALMRAAGVPARLVSGLNTRHASGGETHITEGDGHAWAEVWDGAVWRRFDATPPPKPEDTKQSAAGEQQGTAAPASEKANDGAQGESQGAPESASAKSGQRSAMSEGGNSMPNEHMNEVSDSAAQQSQEALEVARQEVQRAEKARDALKEKVAQAETFDELRRAREDVERSEMFDDMKQVLEDAITAKEKAKKEGANDVLDEMTDDGFMDENRKQAFTDALRDAEGKGADRVMQELERERRRHNEFKDIEDEVTPLVNRWYKYLYSRLPKEEDMEDDEDVRTRSGRFDRRAIMKPRNVLFGQVKVPKIVRSSLHPNFLASIIVDTSGSMKDDGKMRAARTLLIFYSKLFERISREFGYIGFSIHTFADTFVLIKDFQQKFDSPVRYSYSGEKAASKDDFGNDIPVAGPVQSTVKARIMSEAVALGGTNMLDAVQHVTEQLNAQARRMNGAYASAMYFVGDGQDTCGNSPAVKAFMQADAESGGFGDHMYTAIMLGTEDDKKVLGDIFGDDHTQVAGDVEELIEESMAAFERDMREYLARNRQV